MRLRRIPLLGRLVLRAVQRAVGDPSQRWVTIPTGVAGGYVMLVDPRFELGYLRGDHETWLQELLRRWLKPGDAFADVGAHAGFFSLVAARLVGPLGTVHSFEPDPTTYPRLATNAARNEVAWLHPVQAAAWSESGTVLLKQSGEQDAGVRSSAAARGLAGADVVVVRSVRLDDVFQRETPAAIKVDVEGAEARVLDGARALLARKATRWIIELHGEDCERAVLERLEAAGYSAEVIEPIDPVYRWYKQRYVLAAPRVASGTWTPTRRAQSQRA